MLQSLHDGDQGEPALKRQCVMRYYMFILLLLEVVSDTLLVVGRALRGGPHHVGDAATGDAT